jgi:hypothetical protein
MLSGTIIVETVFSWPGLGRLIAQAVRAVTSRDPGWRVRLRADSSRQPVVDLLYAVVDPRVRLSRARGRSWRHDRAAIAGLSSSPPPAAPRSWRRRSPRWTHWRTLCSTG